MYVNTAPMLITAKMIEFLAVMTDRRWMRSAKAWRSFFKLPKDLVLVASLTALVDRKVNADISDDEGVDIVIAPAYIVDVKTQKTRDSQFELILETVYEHQNHIGTQLTAIVDSDVFVRIYPVSQSITDNKYISSTSIKDLHAIFFREQAFKDFLGQYGVTPISHQETKDAFKQVLNVRSCKQITQDKLNDIMAEYRRYNGISINGNQKL